MSLTCCGAAGRHPEGKHQPGLAPRGAGDRREPGPDHQPPLLSVRPTRLERQGGLRTSVRHGPESAPDVFRLRRGRQSPDTVHRLLEGPNRAGRRGGGVGRQLGSPAAGASRPPARLLDAWRGCGDIPRSGDGAAASESVSSKYCDWGHDKNLYRRAMAKTIFTKRRGMGRGGASRADERGGSAKTW